MKTISVLGMLFLPGTLISVGIACDNLQDVILTLRAVDIWHDLFQLHAGCGRAQRPAYCVEQVLDILGFNSTHNYCRCCRVANLPTCSFAADRAFQQLGCRAVLGESSVGSAVVVADVLFSQYLGRRGRIHTLINVSECTRHAHNG